MKIELLQVLMSIVTVAILTFLGWGMIKDELLEVVDTLFNIKKHKREKEANLELFDLIQSILFVIAFLLFYTFLCVIAVGLIDEIFNYDAMLNSGT